MKIKDHFFTHEEFEIRETNIPGVFRTYPTPSNLEPYYDSEKYISHHQDSGTLKEKLYKFLQRFNLNYKRTIIVKELFAGAKILDYGCGAGEFIKYIEEYFETFGYEPNGNARSAAERKVNKAKLVANVEDIPDRSLDAITLWHVFEHIDNQEDIIMLFNKKLKSNGLLVIAVPNRNSYDAKHYKGFWAAYDVPRHLYHFTKSGMEKLFTAPNWKLQTVKPLLLDSFYISMLSEKYKKSPLFWFKGGIHGAISNFKALKTGDFSSLIYVIRKI